MVDFKKNSFEPLTRINSSFSVFNKSGFILNDTLHNFKKGRVISYPIAEILVQKNSDDQKFIYATSEELLVGFYDAAIFVLFLIICVIIYGRYKQNQMPQLSELGFRYNGVNYILDTKEKAIMNLILSNEEVFSQKIYDVVEEANLSYPQNNKIKLDAINSLNNKLFKILGIDEFIESKKSKEDQRVLVYFTNHTSRFSKKSYDR